jgi:phosphatidylinositol kinase/protein kinase (PI-3  family)
MKELRSHRETLLNVLSTMRHDPLVEWHRRNASEDVAGGKESEEANSEIEKIDSKLQGVNLLRGPQAHSVEAQVQQLISDATNINHLSQMYIWWMPWC